MHRLLPILLLLPLSAFAAGDLPTVGGIPIDFILFALTLLGVALFHHATLYVALTGLVTISLYKMLFTGFKTGVGVAGFVGHLGHEWVTIANLFCLLTGFALLARHFEKSHVPVILPKYLPEDWKGGFLCPCHGSTFDLAGRVFKNKPAPDNLEVPPHKYLSDTKILVGEA